MDDWEWHIAVDAFDSALKRNQAKGAFVVGMPENIPEDYTDNYSDRGIVSFYGIDEALQATEIAADIGSAWRCDPAPAVLQLPVLGKTTITLDEAHAKQELQAKGVPIPAGKRVTAVEQARQAAFEIGFPLVLKGLGIAHKTEHDAVRLNLDSLEQVEIAATDLLQIADELYLEAMKPSVAELIVGVTRDPQFGLVLTIGSGGILVELLKDSKTLLIPASRDEIEKGRGAAQIGAAVTGLSRQGGRRYRRHRGRHPGGTGLRHIEVGFFTRARRKPASDRRRGRRCFSPPMH